MPVTEPVKAGFAAPYARDAAFGVIVSGALLIVNVVEALAGLWSASPWYVTAIV
jgi:hypothetical protein